MKQIGLVERAKMQNKTALDEAESKQVLADYGVPVVKETIAGSPDEAAESAVATGFPVVLKALGSALTHKTERGLVRMGLANADEVRRAAAAMKETAGDDLEGWLIQPQLAGSREFVAGMFHDDQFGPVIMFGLGGVYTEALDDVVFRIAPLDTIQAEQMLDELMARDLLSAFRGEPAVDRGQLVKALTGLSKLAEEHGSITEVDINPLLITSEGLPVAVDALVVLGEAAPEVKVRPPVDPARVATMFEPKSVAFVGASSQFRKWGNLLFTNVIAGGFQGDIHLVNPTADSIAGRPVYKSVTDIPGPVDLAVVTVPANRVLGLLPEFKAKGIGAVVLITSGFAETGSEGRKLEEKLVEEARANDLLLLGPNTMGICNPHHGFYCTGSYVRPKPGSTAFVSQSGNMGTQLLAFAEQQGIGIRAFGGSGNEAMLTIEDALDTFSLDRLTNTVLLYIESVKNGRRFFESARKVSRKKPVVVLKGGRTESGGRAAASHTGALASNARVFDAACRQSGVVMAKQPMDLLDLSAAFSSLPLPKGRRVGIMTLGGGWGVVTADLCNEYLLEVPELSQGLIKQIDKLLPPFWSRSNPVDLVGDTDLMVPLKVMAELLKWEGCDAVINLGIIGRMPFVDRMIESTIFTDPHADRNFLESVRGALTQFEMTFIKEMAKLMDEHGKPIIGVSLLADANDHTVIDIEGSRYKGVFFPTPERAVKSLSKMCVYERWLDAERLTDETKK